MCIISDFAKYMLLVFNFLIGVCSLALIVLGVLFYMHEKEGVNVFFEGSNFSLGFIAIAVGVLVLCVAALGCCGSLPENTCLLTIYAIALLILLAMQTTLGVFVILKFIHEEDFLSFLRESLESLFNSTDTNSVSNFHNIQIQFECCGVNNSTDYPDDSYPPSCCGNKIPCYAPYPQGCAEAFRDSVKVYIEIISYVAIGFAAVEFVAVILSMLLRRVNVKRKPKFAAHEIEETSI